MNLIDLGGAYSDKDEYDKAISDFNQALSIDPNYIGAYKNRAMVFFIKKEYDKAWDDIKKMQEMGYTSNPGFLQELQKASNRQK